MLFRKKIDRYCTYCQFAGKIDDETMVCQFCGIVPSDHRCHRLAATAAKFTPVGHRPADEIDEDAAKFWLVAFTQLEMLAGHDQRQRIVIVLHQAPASGKNR